MTEPPASSQSPPRRPAWLQPVAVAWGAAGALWLVMVLDLAALGLWWLATLTVACGAAAVFGFRWAFAARAGGAPAVSPTVEPARMDDLAPLIEALPDAALLVGKDGRVIAANAEARRQLQFNAAGLRLSAVLRQPEVLDAVEAAALDGAARTVEYETASQFEQHFRVYVSPVIWGDARAALAIFTDRTAMINSERMRADFLANASHELKTPVASLSLLVETVAGPAKGDLDAQDRFLPMMRIEIERMRRLIDDLLSLSKIELNEHVPPHGQADLVDIAREAVDSLSPLARARAITVALHPPQTAVPVVGDRFQLAQVAKNLVENAIKYTPMNKAIAVEIGVAEGRDAAIAAAGRRWAQAAHVALLTPSPRPASRYAFLRVTDEGGGIARRHLPRLGERFYRVERPDAAEKTGTGLGLAIVKHIVNRHRGGLLVESELGVGSAFAVYLELAGPQGTDAAASATPQAAPLSS